MTDLTLTRHIEAAPDKVFSALTTPAQLLQ